MRTLRIGLGLLVALLVHGGTVAQTSHADALRGLQAADAMGRFAAVERLSEIGTQPDVARLIERLADDDPRVRVSAHHAIWAIWSRSGDAAIDELLALGSAQMAAGALTEALATFDEVVRRRPAFAEGWNKRATVHYLRGEDDQSLADCAEVFKRNPQHFGALAGAGQIHLRHGRIAAALDHFRRAVALNPNLDGPAQMIPLLEQRLEKSST